MSDLQKFNIKIDQFLIHFFDKEETADIHEFLIHSEIFFEPDGASSWSGAIKLIIVSNPEIYKKYYQQFKYFKERISNQLFELTRAVISNIRITPDLRKFQILENRYTPVLTPWEEINKYQSILIDQLRTATEPVHYQNIGNTSRTIMQKISDIVFNPDVHIGPADKDLSAGKFKNRLHTFIRIELGGEEYKEIRDFSISVIDTAEKSIDLANKLTHSLNADSLIAESCVISTISAVNMIKIIHRKEEH